MEVAKTSEMIYTYESMKNAFEAGERRCAFEEGYGVDGVPRTFEEFMKVEYNDPRKHSYVFHYKTTMSTSPLEVRTWPVVGAYDFEEAHKIFSEVSGLVLKDLTFLSCVQKD